MRLLVSLLALVLLAAACAPASPPTPSAPTSAAPPAKAAPAATAKPAPAATAKPAAPTAQPKPQTLEKLKVGLTTAAGLAGIYIALEKGYFKDQGIEMEWEQVPGASDTIAFLANGQLDVGTGNPSSALFNAIARDLPLQVVAGAAGLPPAPNLGPGYLLARTDLYDGGQVQNLKQVKGLKLAINTRGSGVEYQVAQALAREGMSLKDVDLVTINFPDVVAALSNKAIDIGYGVEPYGTKMQEEGIGKVVGGALTPNMFSVGVFYGKTMLAPEKLDVAKRFLVALARGNKDMATNPRADDNVAIISKYTKVAPDIVKRMNLHQYYPDLRGDKNNLMDQQRWFMENGYLNYQNLVPIEKIYNTQILDQALPAR